MRILELRIPPPLVGLIVAGAMWVIASSLPPLLALPASLRLPIAVLLALTGVVIVLSGVVAFRRAQTTVNPLKPETSTSLVSTGIYRITRNPMYLGMLAVLLAWAAYLSSLLALLGPAAFSLYITRFQIIPEERVLQSLFGAAFIEYTQNVRRWL
ncbi:MAG: isoprenylcysteine carboxylmethyltransferase family protein [Steroidobacteraceae bacterium]